jgi:hypothetical protein
MKYKAGYKYQLVTDEVFQTSFRPAVNVVTDLISLTERGELVLSKGYCSDGPSGPTIDTPNFMRGAFLHDGLYQLMREGLLPWGLWRKADEELAKQCRADGMWEIRIKWVMLGLWIVKGKSAKPSQTKRVRQAP